MWDAFLDRRSCQSCSTFHSRSFYKKKNDLASVEYTNYIHKDVLTFLDPNPMKNSKSKQKKDPQRASVSKNEAPKGKTPPPVYFRTEQSAGNETKRRPSTSPQCKQNESCRCEKKCDKKWKKTVSKQSKSIEEQSIPQQTVPAENNPKKVESTAIAESKVEEKKQDKSSDKLSDKLSAAMNDERRKSRSRSRLSEYYTGYQQFAQQLLTKKDNIDEERYSLMHGVSLLNEISMSLSTAETHTPSSKLSRIRSTRSVSHSIFACYKFGEKGSGTYTKSGQVQDFYRLRDECLGSGTLFEDPEFPATESSLFFSQRPDRYYEWKRPTEIVEDPQFFVEGYSRFDVQQGELGDCWLLAAAANLTLYRRLFFQIVPDDQDFDEKYAGIFHFRFWQYGKWVDVVIDDRLPTYRGELIFLHSTEVNEFWSALLEKAYAKLHGSYEALKGGSTCEAMEDFTGGVTEMYELEASPPNLFQIILKAYERSSLMGCSIEPDPNIVEAQTPEGLIRGHAYSITRVQYVDIQTPNVTGKIPLLRLRNPWGNESEWNGAWSDGAPEWRFISETEKQELGLTFDIDGEFWMSFKDFAKYFSRVEICNLNPDSLSEEEIKEGHKKKWEMSVYEGEWVRGVTAGGCRNFLDSFWHNPQYRITLTEVDDGDDQCTLIVGLMQKNRRHLRSAGVDLLTVGFAIYHLPYADRVPKPLDLNFFKYNASVARSPSFINLREVSCRFKLPPGTYCIVPSTFDPNEEGEFLLRVFTEKQNIMEQHDEDIGYGEVAKKVQEETPTDVEETDKVYEAFVNLAGEDGEVDWTELKQILDYSMRMELQQGKPVVQKRTQKVVNAAPLSDAQTQSSGDNFLTSLFSLFCGTICQNPLAEVIPPPVQNKPTNAALNELLHHEGSGFSKDICRSMVAMLDEDHSGKLGYTEFKQLWLDIRHWKNAWLLYDTDASGTFSGFELREALAAAGFKVNAHVLNILMHRYGNSDGHVNFDDFMMCAIKLKKMLDIFKRKDTAEANTATFTLEEWLEKTLYA